MINYILKQFNIKGIVHVGMHYGQELPLYISKKVNVLGFEPINDACSYLKMHFSSYEKFTIINCALSDYSGEADFYLTSNDQGISSSLLEIGELMHTMYPFVKCAGKEKVKVSTFEEVIKEHKEINLASYDVLLIDTQGSELEVLRGFGNLIGHFKVLVVECSDKPIYEGGHRASEVVEYLSECGFRQASDILAHGDVLFIREGEMDMMKQHNSNVFQQAFADHKKKSLEEAAKGYERVLSVDPNHPSALHLLGLIEFDKKNYESAIELVKKSLALVPNELQWVLNHGKILAKAGNTELSISTYEKALSIDPGCFKAKMALADIYCELGQFTKALEIYDKILGNNPTNADAKAGHDKTLRALEAKGTKFQEMDPAISTQMSLHKTGAQQKTLKEQCSLLEQEKEDHAGVVQRPTGVLNPVTEMGVLANAMYHLGNNALAMKYVQLGFEAVKKSNNIGFVPRELLQAWQAPNLGAMFAQMWLKFCTYSSFIGRKKSKEVLSYWMEQDNDNAEPFIRFGLLMALESFINGQVVPRLAIKALLYADKLMNNDRSHASLMLADRGVLNKLLVPYDGGHLHVYPSINNMTTYVLLEQGDWFEDDLKLFRGLVHPGDSVLDLGANVGVYSISAAQRVGESGRVISVEPCKDTFTLINRSAETFSNMECIHAAVSEYAGRGFLEPSEQPEFNKLQTDTGKDRGEAVDIIPVDELAECVGVDRFDVIKIDVEGNEIPTLRGAKRIIGQGDPIILYEIREVNKVHLELIETFHDLGYDSYYFHAPCDKLIRFQNGRRLDPFVLNMVAVRPESLGRFEGLVDIEQA